MRLRLNSISTDTIRPVIELIPAREVTDSKHAKIIKGMKKIAGEDYLSPFVIAEEFLQLVEANHADGTKSFIICEGLGKFSKRSFCRFSDKNNISSVSRAWWNESGLPLDVQAEIISEQYGREITTEDLVEHVMEFAPGKCKEPFQQEINLIKNDFKKYYDFDLTIGYARFLVFTDRPVDSPF